MTAGRAAPVDPPALALAAARAAADKQAVDIVVLDVGEVISITDLFVLCTGSTQRQVKTIVDAVERGLRELGERPVRREGESEGRWVLLDYVAVVVHVFAPEEREFYGLERLWRDAPIVPFDTDAPSVTPAVAPGESVH